MRRRRAPRSPRSPRARRVARLVVDRLEAVGAGLSDLRPHEVRDVELGLDLGIAPAPLVVAVPGSMTVVLTDDEQRRLDEETEVAVLERAPVSLPDQEADQTRITVVISSEAWLNETRAPLTTARSDASAPSSAMNPWSRTATTLLRYDFGHGGHAASLAAAHVGTSGWSYPCWRPGFYPAGRKPADFLRLLRLALRHGRAEHDRLPPAGRGAVRALGRAVPDGLRFAPKLPGNRAGHRRSAVLRARPARSATGSGRCASSLESRARRRHAHAAARLARPGLRLAFDFRHASWAGVEPGSRTPARVGNDSRRRRRSATCGCASRPTTTRRSRWADRLGPARRDRGLRLLQARGRAHRAGVRRAARAAARGLIPGRPRRRFTRYGGFRAAGANVTVHT